MILLRAGSSRGAGGGWPSVRLALILIGVMLLAAVPSAHAGRTVIAAERITSADGLSQNSINAILQDSAGFIWLGTGDGLNRYDGREIRVFRHDPSNPSTLADNYISALVEAGDGTLWVGTNGGGLDHFDPATGRTVHAQHDEGDPTSLPHNGVNALLIDQDGMLWVGTSGGLAIRDSPTGGFHRPDLRGGMVPNPLDVRLLRQRANGDVFIGIDGEGLYLYRRAGRRFIKLPLPVAELGIRGDLTVNAVQEMNDGTVWLATANAGLLHVALSAESVAILSQHRQNGSGEAALPEDHLTAILPTPDERLWIGTKRSGVVYFDPETGTASVFRSSLADPSSLSGDDIVSLVRDRGGMVWVGTSEHGVARFPETPVFEHYYRDPLRDIPLPDNTVWAFAEGRDGDVWVGTATGLARFSLGDRRFVPLASPATMVPAPLGRDVRALHFDGTDLWAGVLGEGVVRWNPRTGDMVRYRSNPEDAATLSDDRIRLLLPRRDGSLWIGTQNGLNRLDPVTGAVRRYQHVPSQPGTLPHNRIRALFEDKRGILWVGTSAGLARLDDGGTFTIWPRRTGVADALQDGDVRAVHEAADGTLWIGTGHGLTRFHPESGPERTYDERQGLLNATIYGILSDDDGRLWISTNNGLALFDPRTEAIRTFTVSNGIQDNEFNFGAWLKAQSGLMLFGGIKGFSLFHPSTVTRPLPSSAIPTIVLDRLAVLARESSRVVTLAPGEPLRMRPTDDALEIDLAVPHFDRPAANRFSHWMEGLDTGWTPPRTDGQHVRYPALPPGRYVFRARGISARGVASANEIVLPVEVPMPFWQTPLAYALYALVLCTMLYGLYIMRTRMMASRNAWLQAEVASKSRQLQDLLESRSRLYETLSHELQTPLSIVQSALQELAQRLPDDDGRRKAVVMLDSAQRLSRLVKQLLLIARIDSLAPEAAVATVIGPVLDALRPGVDMLAQAKSLMLQWCVDDTVEVSISTGAIELVAQNLLSNAIKYTPAGGQVKLTVEPAGAMVRLAVADTGIGIAPADHDAVFQPFVRATDPDVRLQAGSGLGLSLVRDLVHRHGGSVRLESRLGEGTTVSVLLPRHQTPPAAAVPGYSASAAVPAAEVLDLPAVRRGEGEADRPSLLIIDDDPNMRNWLFLLLRAEFSCHIAATGEAGLELAHDIVPDAVLCDLLLPACNGLDVARALRSDPVTDHIPIILLTALGDAGSRDAGLGLQVDDFLTKPFDNHELVQRLRNVLANRARARVAIQREFLAAFGDPQGAGNMVEGGNAREQAFMAMVTRAILNTLSDDRINQPEIAAACGYSLSSFQRKFRTIVGERFTTYRTRLRMAVACERLLGDDDITDIATAVGYSTSAYFASVFKAQHGVTPQEWRMRHKPPPS